MSSRQPAHMASRLQKGSPSRIIRNLCLRSKELLGAMNNFVQAGLLQWKIDLEGSAFALDAGNGDGAAVIANDLL